MLTTTPLLKPVYEIVYEEVSSAMSFSLVLYRFTLMCFHFARYQFMCKALPGVSCLGSPWYQYQWTSCRPIAPLRRPQTYNVQNQVAELPKPTVLDIRPLYALRHAALTAFQTGNANILAVTRSGTCYHTQLKARSPATSRSLV